MATSSSSFVAADADGYERLMGRWSRRLAQPFLDFVGTGEHERVADLGCGTGHLAAAIAQRSATAAVEGVDIAPAYIARAQAHHGGATACSRCWSCTSCPGTPRPSPRCAVWRGAGLRDVEETTLCIRMEYASFDDYWAPYVGRDGPGAEYVQSLDAARRERLEGAVRAAYLDGEQDGPRSYAALAWAVKGVAP